MGKKGENIFNTSLIFSSEFDQLRQIKEILSNKNLPKDDIIRQYLLLGKQFEQLLKKTIKLTKIGDTYQKKLLKANESIQKQNKELIEMHKQLKLIARTDPLTDLSNRRYMMEKILYEKNRFERNSRSFAIVLVDIDNFKLFNDQYGHDCGDFILVTLAKLMMSMVRKQDSISRWGGEEFLFLLPETDINGGKIISERIREKIAHSSYVFNGQKLSITMTFGVSVYDDIEMDIEEVIKKADIALYKGKKIGKNCVIIAQ